MVIRLKPQNIMCFILGYMMNFQSISTAVMNVVAIWKIPVLTGLATPLLYTSFYACVLIGIFLLLTAKWSMSRLAVTAFFLLSVLMTLLFSPESKAYIWTSFADILGNPTYVFWLYSFTLFLFSGCVEDVQMLKNMLEKLAYVTVGLSLLYYIATVSNGGAPQYMTFSYNMLFSVTLLIILWIQKFSWPRMITGVVGAVMIFIAGCRGALLGLLISVIIYDWFGGSTRTQKQRLSRALLVLLGLLAIIFWRNILEAIASILDSLDIPSRTIYLLLEDAFLEDSGRSHLLDTAVQKFSVVGHGLYGDRLALNGTYIHNMFVELVFDYGMILGAGLALLWIIVLLVGATRTPAEYRLLICALLSVGCVKLFFSGSFLNQEPGVYLLLGMCLTGMRARKERLGAKSTEAQPQRIGGM